MDSGYSNASYTVILRYQNHAAGGKKLEQIPCYSEQTSVNNMLGQFYGENSAFEVKIGEMQPKGNRFTFPKHPSESQLFLKTIKIIALQDKPRQKIFNT